MAAGQAVVKGMQRVANSFASRSWHFSSLRSADVLARAKASTPAIPGSSRNGKGTDGFSRQGLWAAASSAAAAAAVASLFTTESHAASEAAFTIPPLPYPRNALEPHISSETIDFHYGKHHQAYVNNLNGLVSANPALAGKSLEDLIRTAGPGPVFNNAAQVWNHTFYWHSLSPRGGGAPDGALGPAIARQWGSFDQFKAEFDRVAGGQFGSGWAWLVCDQSGTLKITASGNAGTPLSEAGCVPLLTCDVWEHAYYIDYRNARPAYLAAFWKLVNWDFAEANYAARARPRL